jgi:hypothetical protein
MSSAVIGGLGMMPTGGNHFASMSQQCDIFAVFSHSALLSLTIAGQQADYNKSVKTRNK